jgi:very-short-patch-repair endonuclease
VSYTRIFMGKYILKYPHRNIQTARMLRKTMTDVERKLWSRLRSNQLGIKFRRQVPFGTYIADFMSLKEKIVIELDGSQHYQENAIRKDRVRDQYFKDAGFTVLRFSNTEIIENIDGVLDMIWEILQSKKEITPSVSPPVRGRGTKYEDESPSPFMRGLG